MTRHEMTRRESLGLLIGLCVLAIVSSGAYWLRPAHPRLLLAPLMDLTPCLLAPAEDAKNKPSDWLQPCSGPNASAAHLVESTLRQLQPVAPPTGPWDLGYTLKVPLLSLLLPDEQRNWHINQQALDNIARTIRDNPRPVVLYLFSTHFGVNAPIEPLLAQDPDNIAQTPQGPLPIDTYYGQPVYPWSLARTDNPITQYRVQVIGAMLQNLCALPAQARERIRGITLLGEVHQLFPNFESGMGFGGSYQVSDYSATSTANFRRYLLNKFVSVENLNQQLGSNYRTPEDITPPSKDIRRETLSRYQEHLDAYAAGWLPITGWVHSPDTPRSAQTVKIYLDGQAIADAPVHLSRQDVRAARPEFNTADLGWRHDLDFRQLRAGTHRIDLALAQAGRPLIYLDTRSITIMGPEKSSPSAAPMSPLPAMQPQSERIASYADEPHDQANYYYNPLAEHWQAFREDQVLHYLEYFNKLLAGSCLSGTPRYTHQIVPQFNPGWDSSKYAVQATLRPMETLHSGISLYGETSYGSSLTNWLKQSPRHNYSVTEFHPLQALNPRQLNSVLLQHQRNGAAFLSFFVETRWQDQRVSALANPFAFDAYNPQFSSDKLYASMQKLLAP
jgi:hypothetical protein